MPITKGMDERERFDAIGIAASTGSPQWVDHILTALPPDLPCPVFVALHLPSTRHQEDGAYDE